MSQKQVSHPKHARSKVQAPREDKMPKNDRGWGGAGAVGWGVLGAFGSMEKDTGAQVVRRGQPSNFKMVKDEKGLWVKVRIDAPGAGGRGGGIPVMGGEGESVFGGLQDQEDGYGYDDRRRGEEEDEEEEDRDWNRKRSRSRSRSRSRGRERRRRSSRSRSRSRSRGRDRGGDRRSSRRSRSRSRSRDRKSSRRRSRSYSRERERGRERRRQRSVSGSRDRRDRTDRRRRSSPSSSERGRRRDEEEEEERERRAQQQERRRQQQGKEDEAATHEKAAAPLPPPSPPPPPPPPNPEEMSWTAAQLADRLVEVYNTSHPKRYDHIAACFRPDVSLCVLKSGQAVLKGVERLRDSMPSDFARREAQCTRRLLLLSDDPADPSFALDFYPAGHAPGMQAFGKGNTPLDTILLFEAAPGPKNRIAQVWIAPDVKGLATAERVSELDVLSSKAFAQAAAVVKARMKDGATTRQHFHDYKNMETIG